MYLLCAALALACVALAVALRRARADAAFQRHQVDVAGEMLARIPVAAQLAAVAPPSRCAVVEPLPVCSACARLVIGAEVIRNLRAPATSIRGPVAPTEAPRAFIVRWGSA